MARAIFTNRAKEGSWTKRQRISINMLSVHQHRNLQRGFASQARGVKEARETYRFDETTNSCKTHRSRENKSIGRDWHSWWSQASSWSQKDLVKRWNSRGLQGSHHKLRSQDKQTSWNEASRDTINRARKTIKESCDTIKESHGAS